MIFVLLLFLGYILIAFIALIATGDISQRKRMFDLVAGLYQATVFSSGAVYLIFILVSYGQVLTCRRGHGCSLVSLGDEPVIGTIAALLTIFVALVLAIWGWRAYRNSRKPIGE